MNTKTSPSSFSFLQGGGEMGALTRTFDWSQTAIGTPDQWPQSLRTSVSILLNSQFPMFVWWGKDLTTIYNDSYKIIAGDKHPGLLGSSGQEAWSEIWKDLAPLVDNVFKGISTWAEDLVLNIKRHGFVEETYFTFSYSPILDESGAVGGLFCAVIETTEKVFSKKRLEESEARFRNVILQAPFATCIFRGRDFVIEVANKSMCELWGKTAEDVMHKPLFEAIPEAKDQGYEELMTAVFETGQDFSAKELPVNLPRNGGVQKVFVNFTYRPIRDIDGTVSGIVAVAVDVTEQVVARKEIEESEALLQKRVRERTRELANANEELKRSNENLEEFAYAASHDMKEPIRKIHFFSDRLKTSLNGSLSEEQIGYFQRVQTAANRMSTLIDDLLLYSHISRDANVQENVDLNELAALVLEDLDLEREEKKAEITICQLPVVKGHRRQLQQLFQNLIGNSLKYSKPGILPVIGITCSQVSGTAVPASLFDGDGRQACYLIQFKDNGIGFEQLDAERIFNVFTRLHGN
ncbi:MAG TPA: PAS domain-containing protein, partial [Flavisolibacter sp.]|nr:PAS domain-containing protein [Flavisolibacter sp.]